MYHDRFNEYMRWYHNRFNQYRRCWNDKNNFSSPPILTYSALPTFTANQIGYTITLTSALVGNLGSTYTYPVMATNLTLTTGVWMVSYVTRSITTSATVGTFNTSYTWIAPTSNTNTFYGLIYNSSPYNINNSIAPSWNGSAIIQVSSTSTFNSYFLLSSYTTVYGNINFLGGGIASAGSYLTATRIA